MPASFLWPSLLTRRDRSRARLPMRGYHCRRWRRWDARRCSTRIQFDLDQAQDRCAPAISPSICSPRSQPVSKLRFRRLVKLVAYVEDVSLEMEVPWAIRNFEIFRYHQHMFETTPELYDPRTLDRVRGSAGISELDYVRAREALKMNRAADSLLEKFDVLISPTVPVVAPLLSELEAMDSAALRAYEVKYLLRKHSAV